MIPGQVSNGLFGAVWTDDGGEPTRYVAHTANRVFTWQKGVVSSQPR